jgi:hypothetical protein
MENEDFILRTLTKEEVERMRNIRKRRLLNTKIKSLKDKIIQYKSRKEDIEVIQKKETVDTEKEENMIEELKLIDIYIKEYESLINRLQNEYCVIQE